MYVCVCVCMCTCPVCVCSFRVLRMEGSISEKQKTIRSFTNDTESVLNTVPSLVDRLAAAATKGYRKMAAFLEKASRKWQWVSNPFADRV